MNLIPKRIRKKMEATYHECDLCQGLHPRIRKGHGYLLNRVKECSSVSHTLRYGNSWLFLTYRNLIEYERTMKEKSLALYEREQRRREGKWW